MSRFLKNTTCARKVRCMYHNEATAWDSQAEFRMRPQRQGQAQSSDVNYAQMYNIMQHHTPCIPYPALRTLDTFRRQFMIQCRSVTTMAIYSALTNMEVFSLEEDAVAS